MDLIRRISRACWNAYATAFSWAAGGALSRRGLAVIMLLASVVLITGPWLRSSVSRDFRGVHIPWNDGAIAPFLPEYVAQAPRAWRLDSIAVPLLAVVGLGLVVVLVRPKAASGVFGVLLAVSLPALAATLWNHPALFDFFESEIRSRQMLKTVYRQVNDDLMTSRAPDRLKPFGSQIVGQPQDELLEPTHPLLYPFRFWMYGPWLIALAGLGIVASRRGSWPQRLGVASRWAAAGLLLAAAVTWPRLLAEYRWAKAARLEMANDFPAAAEALEQARRTMPSMAHTRRYWIDRGRLDYRLAQGGGYVAFFKAYQYLNVADLDNARATLEPFIAAGGSTIQRDLMSEIVGHIAVGYNTRGQSSAAELAWGEAAAVAPWKPSYWVAQAVTVLSTSPHRAPEIDERLLAQLVEVGDCFVSCDFASALGDAYFEIGQFDRARELYALAMDLFHLPKYVNLHAQEGRLGL
jgi:tetratricopeptide (TPR) repeat protein